MGNSEAKMILDALARKCRYDHVTLVYAPGSLKWRACVCIDHIHRHYVELFKRNDSQCKVINVIGSSKSYAECLKCMIEASSAGYDIVIDGFWGFPDESHTIFLKRGMTEEMLKIEIDLSSVKD